VPLLVAGVAFYALLSLFPAIIAGVSIYGLVADPTTVRDQIDQLTI
jgi:membrane protein